ncbi:MAG: SDR family NAD(P)-dependent oxidoreductase [Bacteroidales bacterium]|nr:SDR family NAD(P)-dependent oxidoreductase [Bacteroidales bacterium]
MEVSGRILVTGATGSMGAAAVETLAEAGHPVLMACRNLAKAEAVRADILSRFPQADLVIRPLDLSSMASVRQFADGLEKGSVQALFNNAGTISKCYSITEDGFENTLSVNYFGPWLLTCLLLPILPADARIVNMVSLTCRYVSLDETALQPTEKQFSQLGTYARAKRALLSFSLELARRYPSLRVNLADPGIVASNMIDLGHWYDPLADRLFKPLCKTPKAGVQPALRALAAAEGNRYYVGKGSRAIPGRYLDPALDVRIWAATEALISV